MICRKLLPVVIIALLVFKDKMIFRNVEGKEVIKN